MRIQMLGSFDVLHEGASVRLGGTRIRITLATLALEVGHVVPLERLIDAVWNDNPPSTARGQIQICVSALRRTFATVGARDAVVTDPSGYALHLDPDLIDAHRFTELVRLSAGSMAQDDLDGAETSLRTALELWSGPMFAGLESDVLAGAAQQMEERRLAAHQQLCDIEFARGRHADAIPELRRLLRDHPLREGLHARLIVALHATGRQAEALEAYRAARTTLVDELGIEPGEMLRDLEQGILRGDGVISLPGSPVAVPASPTPAPVSASVPRLLPPTIGDFTGREKSVAKLLRVLDPEVRSDSSPPTVVISGTGGVGKSVLAVRAAHELAEAYPDGHLYASCAARLPSEVDVSGRILARFLAALGVAPTAIPDGLDERADLFRSRLSGRRVLLVLDGLTTEAEARPLLPATGGCGVIITSRGTLAGLPGAVHLRLDTFSPHHSRRLLSTMLGEARVESEPEAALALAEQCSHLPLALRIAGARLVGRPHWRLSDLVTRLSDESQRLDELTYGDLAVRSTISVGYQGIDPAAQRLLRLLTAFPLPDSASWLAAVLLDLRVTRAEDLLEELVEAHLLEPLRDPFTGEFRYRVHELIRLFAGELAAELDDASEVDAAVERVVRTTLTLARAAHCGVYGGDFTVVHADLEPVDVSRLGLRDLIEASPIAWLEGERAVLLAGVTWAAEHDLADLSWDLASTAVTLHETRAYFDDWREATETALAACRRQGDTVGVAAMLACRGAMHVFQHRYDDAEPLLREAVALFESQGQAYGAALASRNLAFIARQQGRDDEAFALYHQLREVFIDASDLIAKVHVEISIATLLLGRGEVTEAELLLLKALDSCLAVGSRRAEAQVRHRLGEIYLAEGALPKALACFTHVLRIVRHTGDEVGEAYGLVGIGTVQLREGAADEARTSFTAALEIALRIDEAHLAARVTGLIAEMAPVVPVAAPSPVEGRGLVGSVSADPPASARSPTSRRSP